MDQERERKQLAERWPESGFVFTSSVGTPIDPDNCSKLVRAAMTRAGVRVVRLHDLRHGVVSVLLSLGVPPRTVMEIAGHTGLEMTMNVYGHVTLDDKRDALDRLSRFLEEGGMTAPTVVIYCRHPALRGRRRSRDFAAGDAKAQVRPGLPGLLGWRARRDSNPQPSDP